MGEVAGKPIAVVLHTDAQIHFGRASLEPDVADLLSSWNDEGAPLGLTGDMLAHLLGLSTESRATSDAFKALDTDQNLKVDALEVLSSIVMLARGELDAKLEALFSVFDFSGAGRLNFDELSILLTSLCRGLVKVCSLHQGGSVDPGLDASEASSAKRRQARQAAEALITDECLAQACRQAFDCFNLPYDKHISWEQLRRWAHRDVDAIAFLSLFQEAWRLSDLEALITQREEAQVSAFLPLCTDPSAAPAVPLGELLKTGSVRQAFLPLALGGSPATKKGAAQESEEETEQVRALLTAMVSPSERAAAEAGAVTASRFADGARAWNSFAAADPLGTGQVPAERVPLLLWLSQVDHGGSPQDLAGDAARERLAALGLPTDAPSVARGEWVAACLGQSQPPPPPAAAGGEVGTE